ncbi:glycine dehydrogenase (decarboxylating) [mine drainage metagenome]|uniref:glycine dehydrogenase (aminomethyl-transferring) n=1 Tax=mine drainage metagenome TaxID=410659 RepID=A0A1J5RKI8_9ZZZZ
MPPVTPRSPRVNKTKAPLADLEQRDAFVCRHIGPDEAAIAAMLATVGCDNLEQLIGETVPAAIRLAAPLDLPQALPEHEALAKLKGIAAKNRVMKSLIGMGYHDTLMPAVIQRNVLENPGWYTAYTPYQAEIAQGRLEALLNFQQLVIDLTGLPLANASLLDEATAAAEAMSMARRVSRAPGQRFFVDQDCFPQTIDVLQTRADTQGFELIFGKPEEAAQHEIFGALFQYPNDRGEVADLSKPIAAVRAKDALAVVATDPMALVLLKSPGEMGADICLGSAQRFGVPLGFGGPHAAFFACRDEHKRAMPGRIIGVSIDARGQRALRMALQTREQHIRREKANSNICTSQVLLANIAGMYAVYHGPEGLRTIASRIHRLAAILAAGLSQAGIAVLTKCFFDTLRIELGSNAERVHAAALAAGFNLRKLGHSVLAIAVNERTSREDIATLLAIITGQRPDIAALDARASAEDPYLPEALLRSDAILAQPVFNSEHSETRMLRYLKRLQNKDLALDQAMIPLGSCTMKLNAAAEMVPISWPEFADLHPFAPLDQAAGYLEMIGDLERSLGIITGFDAVSLQPNAGSQGEYAGLVAIRRYHASRGEGHRDICLIPKSAHGTNPASAHLCGLAVVTVACDEAGNIDLADLAARAEEHAGRLACLMITYPSTHGVFEEAVKEVCALIHARGGQVYMDGANLNAQVGLTSPAAIGADVAHMNLHKTFCIPHGGGGPGVGPIGVRAHLAPFLPDHVVQRLAAQDHGQGAVSAAPWGSASILPITWMYLAMMGGAGLKRATEVALLNANYLAARLQEYFPVLYVGVKGRVAHECIIDVRPLKAATGITETDIAKRLMDYGFHAPTVSFPVAGTLMIEPTESESKPELDRFIAALAAIRAEIDKVAEGIYPAEDNPLKNAPHTQADLAAAQWHHPYSREVACFPLPYVAQNKFWPTVGRIDDVWGDRNLCCALA